MHEHGIAEELVAAVDRNVNSHGGHGAVKVVVEISPGAVEEQSLRTAFELAKQDTTSSGAELVLVSVAQEAFCLNCEKTVLLAPPSAPASGPLACPVCGAVATPVFGTSGVTLKSIEIEV